MRGRSAFGWPTATAIAGTALLVAVLSAAVARAAVGDEGCAHQAVPCGDLRIGGNLPRPCTLPLADYERVLYRWMNERRYSELGWEKDLRVRGTGPFVFGGNYGTHPAVRIYYSLEVTRWLRTGRPQDGQTCDGWFWAGPSRVTRGGRTGRDRVRCRITLPAGSDA